MTGRRLGAGAAALGLAGALALGACGISTDDSPRLAAVDELPSGLAGLLTTTLPPTTTTAPPRPTTTTTTVPTPVFELPLWFVESGMISRAVRESDDPVDLVSALAALEAGPSDDDAEAGLRSALVADDVIASASVEGGVVVVELTAAFGDTVAADQVLALAQIVFTATEPSGVGRVQFLLGGQPIEVPRADGSVVSGTVSRDDYAALAAA